MHGCKLCLNFLQHNSQSVILNDLNASVLHRHSPSQSNGVIYLELSLFQVRFAAFYFAVVFMFNELKDYLSSFGFEPVETFEHTSDWGDVLFVKKK